MPVVATAGHVDHGKSTLIQALTGRDPDRLDEEKRRGLTIDLGFAWMDLPRGRRVSFVDVPGHRRFIGNMLMGVGPVDAALLVVAANEGWMPQSEEHLAVLDLLQIERAVVAVTKVDLVESATVGDRIDEVRKRLSGTLLENSQLVAVSADNGVGLDQLTRALDELVPDQVGDEGRPRLWVDRVFTVAGAGTVITGTLTGGSLEEGELLEIWPSGDTARIRALQTNDQPAERVAAMDRVAANLAGSARVGRGSLLTKPGSTVFSRRWLVDLRPARYEQGLFERGAFLVHLGTLSVTAAVKLLGDGFGIVDVENGVPVEAGDRFVLRDTGRQRVIAGGVVLLPSLPRGFSTPSLGHDLRKALARGADEVANVMLANLGRAKIADLLAWSGGGNPEGLVGGGMAISLAEADRLSSRAAEIVADFQARQPHEPGIGAGRLAADLAVAEELIQPIVTRNNRLHVTGSVVSATDVKHDPVESDPRWHAALENLRSISPPSIEEVGLRGDLLRALVRTGRLIRVSDDFVYLPESIDEIVAIVRSFDSPFSVSDFRQKAGISRKYAVPLLEYTDREGITLRQGDLRTARH